MKKLLFHIGISLLMILFLPESQAQTVISGTVSDENGSPLHDAAVLLKTLDKGTYTDTAGHFLFHDIPPGRYHLNVTMVGYLPFVRNITLREGEKATVNVILKKDIHQIGEVSVVGESIEKHIFRDPAAEPLSLRNTITVVGAAAIGKEGAITLTDALHYVPGGLTETRGRKVKQFFSVRGQTYPYPSYSLDGIMQKEFYETASFVNISGIREIRVDRSASALLKSLSPLSGVIDVVSRDFTKKTTEAEISWGSMNTFNAGLLHGNHTGDVEYSAGVHFFGTNGPAGRNGKERIVNTQGNISWQVSDKIKSSLRLFYLGGIRQLVQPIEPAAAKFRNRQERYDPLCTVMIASKTEYNASEKLKGELQVNYAYRNPKYYLKNLSTGDLTVYREKDHELTINHLNSWSVTATNILRFGVLYNHWLAPRGKRYYWGHRADVHTWSVVITDQQRFGRWLTDAGIRISQEYYREWSAFAIEGSGTKFTAVDPIRNEWQPPVWQASAGVTYAAGSQLSLHGNVTAGIVTPRKGAMTADGTPPLNEARTNIDLGLIKKHAGQGGFTLTAFYTSRKNAIDYSGETLETDNGQVVELYTNIDKRSYGLEGEIRRTLPAGRWDLFANMMVMRGETRDTVWRKDDELPAFIGNLGTTFRHAAFETSFFMNYTGAYRNDRFVSKEYLQQYGKAHLGNFFDLNLTAGYKVGRDMNTKLFAEIHNILDRHYQTVSGWPDNGRIFRGGVKVKF